MVQASDDGLELLANGRFVAKAGIDTVDVCGSLDFSSQETLALGSGELSSMAPSSQ